MSGLMRALGLTGLALWFALSAPGIAHADPVTAAIVSLLPFAGTAAGATAVAVATFVVNTTLYTAASWAVSKIGAKLGRSKASVQERQASVTTLSLGEQPRELVVGEACTAGQLIDIWNHGGQYGTDSVTRCVGLADHLLDGVVGYYVDDQYYPWVAGGVQPGFSGALTIDFVNATMDGAPPPARILAMTAGGWTSSDTLASIAHVWITYKFDEKVWTQGHPQLKFVVRGARVYDPRKDAALGYVGPNPHVWSNPATHEFTRNAALLRYHYVRGVYAVGRQGQLEHLLIGRGLTAEEAPPERIIAAANVCDETGADGQPRYRANGVIKADEDFLLVEENFAAAMAGVIVQREGGVEIEPGQAKAAVVTITDGDLVAGAAVSFSEFLPDTEDGRVNTIVPRYVEPAQGWKDHAGPVRRSLADIAKDGGPREATLPLMLVTHGPQADWCAEVARLLGRLERRASIVLPPDYGYLEEGDWIAWTSARRHGGATVRYRIESFTLDEAWRMHLVLREIASSVFGVADPQPDTSQPPPPPVPVDALQLLGVSAEAITLPGETAVLPAVRFHWDVPVDAAVRAIRAEVRRSGETEAAPTRTEDVNAGVLVATNGVGPDQALQVRLVPIGDPTRPVLPSNWITVTTGTLVAGEALTIGGVTAAEVVEGNRQLSALGRGTVADAFRRVADLELVVAEALGSLALGYDETQAFVRAVGWIESEAIGPIVIEQRTVSDRMVEDLDLIGVRSADGTAWILDVDTVMVSPTQSMAQRFTHMEVTFDDAIAVVENSVTLVAGDLSAEIDARELLAVEVDDNQAYALDQIELVATDAEASASSLSLLGVKVGGGSAFRLSESTVQVGTRGSLGTTLNALLVTAPGQSAAVVDLITIELNESGGVVSRLSTLELETDDGFANITELFEITDDLEAGLSATVGLALNVNDHIIGVRYANDGTTGSIIWVADEFALATASGTPYYPMAISGGKIRFTGDVVIDGDLLLTGTVETPAIADNAVTNSAFAYTAGSTTMSPNTDNIIQTVTYTCTGGRLVIMPGAFIHLWHPSSGDPDPVAVKVNRIKGGVTTTVFEFEPPFPNGDLFLGWQTPSFEDSPGAGSVTYRFIVRYSTTNFDTQTARARSILVQEFKK